MIAKKKKNERGIKTWIKKMGNTEKYKWRQVERGKQGKKLPGEKTKEQ